ncbi:MAG: NAD-dependent epimerase/dehydratase family protein [Spirochaetota bacterium]
MEKNTSHPEVLVTGANGALAQKVIEQLKGYYKPIAVDFRKKVNLGEDIPSYFLDIQKRSFEDIFREHEIKAVIHLGRMRSSELQDRKSRYNTNVIGTKRLFELCRKYKVGQVIILSTYHVYGADRLNPALLDEDAPLKASGLTRDLVDSVELENLAQINLWKHPELNITILRPCNIIGSGIRNSISQLLSGQFAPILMGFSPIMQFIHVDDMVSAIIESLSQNKAGIYNVAPDECVPYGVALMNCGCLPIYIPSLPELVPKAILAVTKFTGFPDFLMNYYKYPVVIDSSLFNTTFNFSYNHSLDSIFRYYRNKK